ncbi:hypothetical protein [Aestuariibacter salexigens]|uniref:hypothetical protein n=1 Tax=Aestuariibacter salexigens TaxID=226010 RepID=UPI000420DDA4|nr:hypothetical protein [Aestuariibacter salexigens]
MNSALDTGRPWIYVDSALAVSKPLAWMVLLAGTLAMLGYMLGVPIFYRPIEGGAATHPLTCVFLIVYGVCILLDKEQHSTRQLGLGLLTLSVLLCLMVIVEKFTDTNITNVITPFSSNVIRERDAGLDNSMGMNTALLMLFVGLSVLAQYTDRYKRSQLFALCALFMPLLGLFGYIFELTDFYGHMSLLTATMSFMLCFSLLCKTAHTGVVRAVLSPYIGGIIARVQLLAVTLFVAAIVYFFINTITATNGDAAGLLFTSLYWMALGVIGLSALAIEKVDEARRMDR